MSGPLNPPPSGDTPLLISDIRSMIEETRSTVAQSANAALTLLYWRIGQRILVATLEGQRAEYGKQIVITVAQALSLEFGKGFSEKSLRRMIQFAEVYPDEEIVVSLIRQLSWTHFIALIPLKDSLQRDFYAELCRLERWSVKTLRRKIDSMLYERTALSRKPETLIQHELGQLQTTDTLTPELVFRDPYLLDFLGLQDRYLEKDLEDAIMREMETFLLELGGGFAFISRQQRIQIGSEDFYIDLLLYNRYLRRLVVVELKLGDFKAEYKGQMELYLRWLDKHERQPGEEAPLGIILCAGKQQEMIELLELDQSGIHVADYLTVLPPKAVLKERLHQAIEQSRQRLEAKTDD